MASIRNLARVNFAPESRKPRRHVVPGAAQNESRTHSWLFSAGLVATKSAACHVIRGVGRMPERAGWKRAYGIPAPGTIAARLAPVAARAALCADDLVILTSRPDICDRSFHLVFLHQSIFMASVSAVTDHPARRLRAARPRRQNTQPSQSAPHSECRTHQRCACPTRGASWPASRARWRWPDPR